MKNTKTNFSDALFPKVRQQVLGLLYGQADSNFHTNEIIRLTASGTGAVQRELEKLTSAGIITMQIFGKQKRYQANHTSPIFSELRSLILKTFGLADVIRKALIPIATQIYIAFIYGSIAKQEDSEKSDIDLMLISDTLAYSDAFPLLEVAQAQLGRVINPTVYSPDEWKRKLKSGNNFLKQVSSQPKIFLIGIEDDFIKIGKPRKNRASKK